MFKSLYNYDISDKKKYKCVFVKKNIFKVQKMAEGVFLSKNAILTTLHKNAFCLLGEMRNKYLC